MIGEARVLAVDVRLPDGVTLRQVTEEADVRAMSAVADEVFGDPVSDDMADALLHRLSLQDGMELWVAEAEGRIVSTGRLEPVPDTDFAGIWGGATRPAWRGRRDLPGTDGGPARDRALRMGKTLVNSDSTRVLAADPGAGGPGQGLHDHALPLASLSGSSTTRTVDTLPGRFSGIRGPGRL